jgi:hypothetical protein
MLADAVGFQPALMIGQFFTTPALGMGVSLDISA